MYVFAIRFTSDVQAQLQQGDLVVHGLNTANYPVTAFTYDPATRTGVWTLGTAVTNDKLMVILDDAGIAGLDGEWLNANAAESYPSGDGTPGGDFNFRINVLGGDANQDGSVNALDLSFVKQKQNKTATNPGVGPGAYSPFADVDANGSINALDLSAVKQRLNRRLPPGEPTATALLFSSQRISH